MKKVSFVLISLVLMFFCSCGSSNKSPVDLIPTDATFVIRLDSKEVLKKMNAEANKGEVLNALIPLIGISKSTTGKINPEATVLKSKDSCGIDFEETMYAFGTSSFDAVSFNLKDAKDFKKELVISGIAKEGDITKSKGIELLNLNNETVFAWNKHLLLICKRRPTADVDLQGMAKALFSQKKENKLTQTETFKAFLTRNSDLSIYGSYQLMSNMLANRLGYNIDFSDNMQGIIPTTYISFNPGEIVAETNLLYTNKVKEKELADAVRKIFGSNTGKHLAYFDRLPDAFITTNINGDNLKEYLGIDGLSKQIGKIPFLNLNMLISNLNGDLTCTFAPDTSGKAEISYILIDMKSREAIDGMLTQLSQPSFQIIKKIGENSYQLPASDYTIGIKDNLLYCTKDQSFQTKNISMTNVVDPAILEQIKNSKIFIYGNSQSILSLTKQQVQDANSINLISGALALCQNYTVTVSEKMDIDMKLILTDKTHNSLAVLMQYMKKVNADSVNSNLQ